MHFPHGLMLASEPISFQFDGCTYWYCSNWHVIVRTDEYGTFRHLDIVSKNEAELWRFTVHSHLGVFCFFSPHDVTQVCLWCCLEVLRKNSSFSKLCLLTPKKVDIIIIIMPLVNVYVSEMQNKIFFIYSRSNVSVKAKIVRIIISRKIIEKHKHLLMDYKITESCQSSIFCFILFFYYLTSYEIILLTLTCTFCLSLLWCVAQFSLILKESNFKQKPHIEK